MGGGNILRTLATDGVLAFVAMGTAAASKLLEVVDARVMMTLVA